MNYSEQPSLPIRTPMHSQAIVTALGIWERTGARVHADACRDVELLARLAARLKASD